MATWVHDLSHQAQVVNTINQAVTTTTTGTTGDFLQSDGEVTFMLSVGAVGGTGSPVLTVNLQESTDGTTWTALSMLNAVTQMSAITTGVQMVGGIRTLRFLRSLCPLPAGNTPSFAVATHFIEGFKQI